MPIVCSHEVLGSIPHGDLPSKMLKSFLPPNDCRVQQEGLAFKKTNKKQNKKEKEKKERKEKKRKKECVLLGFTNSVIGSWLKS